MAPLLATAVATALAPLHLISYSALLGTELYQTFINTKICYLVLPGPSFIRLQARLFPIYFRTQALLLLATALTMPPLGPMTWVGGSLAMSDAGLFVVAGWTAMLNLFRYGPKTRGLMLQRSEHSNQVAEGKIRAPSEGEVRQGGAAEDLNRAFSRNHAMSIHLNLISVGAMLLYGLRLGSRLGFETA